jgi:hypothetical protein
MNGLTKDQLSAIKTCRSGVTTLLGAIDSDDIPSAYIAANAETLPNPNLPTEPVNLQRYVGQFAFQAQQLDFRNAKPLGAYIIHAAETWARPEDLGGGVPAPYEEWLLQQSATPKAEKTPDAAHAAPEPTRAFDTLPPVQQEALTRTHKAGSIVHVGRDYVKVPEELEAMLGSIEGAEADIGEIPGLSAA